MRLRIVVYFVGVRVHVVVALGSSTASQAEDGGIMDGGKLCLNVQAFPLPPRLHECTVGHGILNLV